MKEYQVKITPKAKDDMEEIYNYIAYSLLAPQAAMNQYNNIADAILSLSTMPERCPLMQSKLAFNLNLRCLLVGNYSVLFRVNDQVTIVGILYSSSNIDKILSQRIKQSRPFLGGFFYTQKRFPKTAPNF